MDKFRNIQYENYEEGDITNNFEENSQPKVLKTPSSQTKCITRII